MCFCTPLTSAKIKICVAKKESRVNTFFFNEKWHNGGIGTKTLSFGLEDHELTPISATILSEASYLTSASPLIIPLV